MTTTTLVTNSIPSGHRVTAIALAYLGAFAALGLLPSRRRMRSELRSGGDLFWGLSVAGVAASVVCATCHRPPSAAPGVPRWLRRSVSADRPARTARRAACSALSGSRVLEELEPCGNGGEEAAHRDARATCSASRSDLRGDAFAHGNLRANLSLGWTRDERDAGDGGDAGERLPRKPSVVIRSRSSSAPILLVA